MPFGYARHKAETLRKAAPHKVPANAGLQVHVSTTDFLHPVFLRKYSIYREKGTGFRDNNFNQPVERQFFLRVSPNLLQQNAGIGIWGRRVWGEVLLKQTIRTNSLTSKF